MRCIECGAVISDDSIVCEVCGAEIPLEVGQSGSGMTAEMTNNSTYSAYNSDNNASQDSYGPYDPMRASVNNSRAEQYTSRGNNTANRTDVILKRIIAIIIIAVLGYFAALSIGLFGIKDGTYEVKMGGYNKTTLEFAYAKIKIEIKGDKFTMSAQSDEKYAVVAKGEYKKEFNKVKFETDTYLGMPLKVKLDAEYDPFKHIIEVDMDGMTLKFRLK